jgi:hypothetical protein
VWQAEAVVTRQEAAVRGEECNCGQLTQKKLGECKAEEADTQQCRSSGLKVVLLWKVALSSCRKCGVEERRRSDVAVDKRALDISR